ncbi:ATP-binding protein [Bifidobacterium pseudocatenulatum]|uniref:ATP-binding protein n=1 Tax=Bifidobacterium pseudocatenulatum TaxID=28026 RepID=UPI000E4452A5|nr:ATP-binding protein [Bifidobacterium pseudocatenulatum]
MIATLLPICPIARPYHSPTPQKSSISPDDSEKTRNHPFHRTILKKRKIIHFTGRYVELKMLPLSFSEYRNALQPTANDNALFDRYLTYGGLLFVTQLTLDTIGLGDYQDIRHRNILDWLLE